MKPEIKKFIERTRNNEKAILESKNVYCLFCGSITNAKEVSSWHQEREEMQALCPHCHFPLIIGDNETFPSSKEKENLHRYFLSDGFVEKHQKFIYSLAWRFINDRDFIDKELLEFLLEILSSYSQKHSDSDLMTIYCSILSNGIPFLMKPSYQRAYEVLKKTPPSFSRWYTSSYVLREIAKDKKEREEAYYDATLANAISPHESRFLLIDYLRTGFGVRKQSKDAFALARFGYDELRWQNNLNSSYFYFLDYFYAAELAILLFDFPKFKELFANIISEKYQPLLPLIFLLEAHYLHDNYFDDTALLFPLVRRLENELEKRSSLILEGKEMTSSASKRRFYDSKSSFVASFLTSSLSPSVTPLNFSLRDVNYDENKETLSFYFKNTMVHGWLVDPLHFFVSDKRNKNWVFKGVKCVKQGLKDQFNLVHFYTDRWEFFQRGEENQREELVLEVDWKREHK